MKRVLITILVTLGVIIGVFLIYIYSGSYDISQTSPHKGLVKWMIGTTTKHSIKKRVKEVKVPEDLSDEGMITMGFSHYNEMCAVCHGAPGIDPNELAEGLYPEPPNLMRAGKFISPQAAFWIIKNGIKYTSMPAFGPSHSDEKLWALTAFITKKLPDMSPEEYEAWVYKYGEHEEGEMEMDHKEDHVMESTDTSSAADTLE